MAPGALQPCCEHPRKGVVIPLPHCVSLLPLAGPQPSCPQQQTGAAGRRGCSHNTKEERSLQYKGREGRACLRAPCTKMPPSLSEYQTSELSPAATLTFPPFSVA